MQIIASVAVSLDGFMDDASQERLILSNDRDMAAVEALRAECDAVLVGAETIRRDNPSLATKTEARRRARQSWGLPPDPLKITLTRSGRLDSDARFFNAGSGTRLVFCPLEIVPTLNQKLKGLAEITALPQDRPPGEAVISALSDRGASRLLIEGGAQMISLFLSEGLIHRLRIAIAPYFVGGSEGSRLTIGDRFPSGDGAMRLDSVSHLGEMAILEYRASGE